MKTETNYKCPRYRASVLLAHAEGEPIEITSVANEGEGGWILSERPLFNFREFDFRVAETQESNASDRLIAAAPELLRACEDALYIGKSGETIEMVRSRLRAAIAKATGKESDQ